MHVSAVIIGILPIHALVREHPKRFSRGEAVMGQFQRTDP